MERTGFRRSRRAGIALAALLAVAMLGAWLVSLEAPVPAPVRAAGERGSSATASSSFPDPDADERNPPPDPDRPNVRVRGRVLSSADGRPIPGALVTLTNTFDEWRRRTDATGSWDAIVPVPRWRRGGTSLHTFEWPHLAAEAPGFLRRGMNLAIPEEAADWTAPTLFLDPAAATVSGRVTDPEGRPIVGARFRVSKPAQKSGSRRRVVWASPNGTCDADGRFGPVPVPAGELSVSAWRFGWIGASRSVLVRAKTPPADVGVEIVLARCPRIEGVVVDEDGRPIPGVDLRSRWYGPPDEATDERGRFTWPLDDPGAEPKVIPAKAGYIDLEFGQRIRRGGENRVVLHHAAPVLGRVLDHEGRPVPDVVVSANFEISGNHQAITDAGGRFRIEDVHVGPVKLHVTRHGIDLARVPVDVPGPAGGFTLRLAALGTIPVTVVDAVTGRPIEGATIVGPNARDLAVTDAAGRVVLEHGDPAWLWHVMTVRRPGYAMGESPLAARVAGTAPRVKLARLVPTTVVVRGADGSPASGATISFRGKWPRKDRVETCSADGIATFGLPPGVGLRLLVAHPFLGVGHADVTPSDALRVDVVLERAARPPPEAPPPGEAVLAGCVVEPDGRPVPGAQVVLDEGSVRTDGLGRFRFVGLVEGRAHLLELVRPPFDDGLLVRYVLAGEEGLRLESPGFATVRFVSERGPLPEISDAHVVLPDRRDPRTGEPLVLGLHLGGDREVGTIVPSGRIFVRVLAGPLGLHESLDLEPGGEATLRLGPRPVLALTGVVLRADGEPASGAAIVDAVTGSPVAFTRDDGRIALEAEAVPTVGPLRVSLRGHAHSTTEPLDLVRGADLTVRMSPGGTVVVTVLGVPSGSPATRVRVRSPFGRHGGWERIVRDRPHRFEHVAAGEREIEVRTDGRLPVIRRVTVDEGGTTEVRVTLP